MEIILNNRQEKIEKDSLTIQELLEYKNFTFRMLVIKVNGKLIKKDAYNTTVIKEGDNVTVMHLVSGG